LSSEYGIDDTRRPDGYPPKEGVKGYLVTDDRESPNQFVYFQHDRNTDEFTIIDIKTSTRGWHDKMKKNEDKQFQLILYKKYFSELYNIPLEKIDIKFFIVKRKLYEECDWPQTRIQEFRPPSGKIKLNRATKYIKDFMDQVFDSQGNIKEQNYPCTCRYCE
jgi:hypothetical protein